MVWCERDAVQKWFTRLQRRHNIEHRTSGVRAKLALFSQLSPPLSSPLQPPPFSKLIWNPPGVLTFLFCFLSHRSTFAGSLLAATRSEKIAVHFDPQWMEASFSGCWQLNQPASHWWVSDYFQSASQYVSAVIECQHPCPALSWPNVMAFLFCLINDIWNNTDTFQQ